MRQIAQRGHHSIHRLASRRRLANHTGVLAAFDAFGPVFEILDGEVAFGFAAGHPAASAVAATPKASRVAFAANDVRARTPAAGDDAEVAVAGAHGALAGDQNVAVALASDVVVMAVDGLPVRGEWPDFAGIGHSFDDLFHHQVAGACEILRPFDGLDIIVEMLDSLFD